MLRFILGLALMIVCLLVFAGAVAGQALCEWAILVLGIGVWSLAGILGFTEARDGAREVWRK